MANVNLSILVGNLGQDCETREINSKVLITFRMATTKSWKDKQGNQKSETQWHNINYWTKTDSFAQYLKKGQQVYVEGEIIYEEHEGKYYTKIRANKIQLLGGKKEDDLGF